MFELTGFQRDALFVMAGLGKPHGLAIKDKLQEIYEVEVNHGRLYPNLDELVENGYVEKGEIDKRTNYYTLTSAGKDLLKKRQEWEQEMMDRDININPDNKDPDTVETKA